MEVRDKSVSGGNKMYSGLLARDSMNNNSKSLNCTVEKRGRGV